MRNTRGRNGLSGKTDRWWRRVYGRWDLVGQPVSSSAMTAVCSRMSSTVAQEDLFFL